MHHLSVAQLAKGLRERNFSAVEIAQHFLQRIEKYNGKLNAFLTLAEDVTLKQARAADSLLQSNEDAPLLTGIPIAHKDLFCTDGIRTTCGSKILNNFIAPYNATIIDHLHAKSNAVVLGKTNMDEFAMGSSNENSYFGPVANPWDTLRVPGGSSGGSAAAIAASLAPLASCTDTGGSIRQPASLCGISGIKPTYGRVSRYGMIAFASSLDQAGVMARTAEDCSIMLEAMAGWDYRDSTSIDKPVPNYYQELTAEPQKKLRIGIVKEHFNEGLNEDVAAAVLNAIDILKNDGMEIVEVSLPKSVLSIPAYYVVAPAECSSNLSRFDGVRYGYRTEEADDLETLFKRSRSEGFGAEVKRRILIGTYVLSAGYYDAYYKKAQRIRRLILDEFNRAFESVDVILGPTTPTTAFKLGDKTDDPVTMYLCDIYTNAVNLAGLPGMSIPVGFGSGLPIGLQLIGPHFEESRLLKLAHHFQQLTDFHMQSPAMFEN